MFLVIPQTVSKVLHDDPLLRFTSLFQSSLKMGYTWMKAERCLMLKVWAAESYFGPTLRCSSPHLPDIKACVTDNTPTGANTPSPRSQHLHDCRETAETRAWTSAFETFFSFCMSPCAGCWLDTVGLLWSVFQVNINFSFNVILWIRDWKI